MDYPLFRQQPPTEGAFEDDKTKLDGIEAGADDKIDRNYVTTAAGTTWILKEQILRIKIGNNIYSFEDNVNDSTTGVLTAGGFTTTGTWTFDGSGGGTVGITSVQPSTASFGDSNVTLMTAAAIQDKIGTYAGTGLSLSNNQFNIDSSVVTLTGTQTLTGKTLQVEH